MLTAAVSTTVTSVTSMLAVGLTTGSAILSVMLILTFMTKEITVGLPLPEGRLLDSLNAVLIPLIFAFVVILGIQTLSAIQ